MYTHFGFLIGVLHLSHLLILHSYREFFSKKYVDPRNTNVEFMNFNRLKLQTVIVKNGIIDLMYPFTNDV